jgi:hypothetical protein
MTIKVFVLGGGGALELLGVVRRLQLRQHAVELVSLEAVGRATIEMGPDAKELERLMRAIEPPPERAVYRISKQDDAPQISGRIRTGKGERRRLKKQRGW